MCGLAGIVALDGVKDSERIAKQVLAALSRRGPDASRMWLEGPCALFHTRRRVLDLLPRSDQPMERMRGERVVIAR